jgi:peptide/nickel transport system permease protein
VSTGVATIARWRPPASVQTLQRSLRYGRMRLGLALTALVVLVALVGPLLAPHDPTDLVAVPFAGPGGGAPLGTDYIGRDVLSRLLAGGRSVVWMSLAATTFGVGMGVVIGMVAGYSRNWVDGTLMRPLDVILAFPQIVLALLFVAMLGSKAWLIVVLVGLSWVPPVARVTRAITLECVDQDYIAAVQAIGLSRHRILIGEILPNLTTPVMVEFGLRLTWSIAVIAGLSFLGIGVQPPTADWGLMVNENRTALATQPLAVAAPALAIATLTIGTNLMAEGVARTMAGIDRTSEAE